MKNTNLLFYPFVVVLFFLYGCSHGGASDTGDIEGVLTDSISGATLAGVMVTYAGISQLTDENGTYYFSDVSVGQNTLTATRAGYENLIETVVIRANTTVTYNAVLIPSETNPEDVNLLAHYTLNAITNDNYVVDSSPNHIDGAVAGGVYVVDGPGGDIDKALRFDGDGDYIVCPENPAILNYHMTISFWAKYDNANGYTLSFHDIIDNENVGLKIIFHIGKVAISYIHSTSTEPQYVQLSHDTNLLENEWYHIAVVIDSSIGDYGQIKPFINGEHIAVRDHSLAGAIDHVAECKLYLGATNSSVNWRGDLADVRIYGDALSSEQINVLYTMGRDPQ